ncbi:MAG: hypothetical protein KY432_01155 [Acidobacteria bacterium]|nr:hypothetical protein [Acidobacteriota bacterium]
MSRMFLWVTIVVTVLPTVACGHADATVSEDSRLLSLSAGARSKLDGEHLDVEMSQAEFPDAGAVGGTVDVPFHLKLKNRSVEPVRLEQLNLRSVGQGVYEIEGRSRIFDDTIEPGEETTIKFWSRAIVHSGGSTKRPVTLRLVVEYVIGEDAYQDSFVDQINGRFKVGIELDA